MKLFVLGMLITTAWAIPEVINPKIQELAKRASSSLLFLSILYLL